MFTAVCRIVRRWLILVHKWQFTGYGWHPIILIPTQCPPIIFTNFSWAKSHNFFILQKSKFTEIYNICSNWLLLQSIKGTCFEQIMNIFVNFDFCNYEKIMRLSPWKIGEYSSIRTWRNACWRRRRKKAHDKTAPEFAVKNIAGNFGNVMLMNSVICNRWKFSVFQLT